MKRYYFIFSKNNILLEQQSNGTFTIPCAEEVPIGIHPWTHVLNISPMDDGTEVKALMVDDPKSIEATDDQLRMDGWVFKSLRESFYHLPEPLYLKAGKCEELLYWDHNTQFCGVCGAPMKMSTDISKRCTQCGKEVWPQLATAVIVLIRKGDEVLLVHARNFASDFYGLVAGFVETGETLEECVKREVWEETRLHIRNLRYFASQPWPFPNVLMVGFTAEYADGELMLQTSELKKGGWFRRDNLPDIPGKVSLARRLIDHWLNT